MKSEFEKTADTLDQASHLAEMINSAAVDAQRAKSAQAVAPEQDPDNIDPYCIDCGAEIPEARLAMLRCRCVDCQSALEKREKVYAGR